jgi:PAS domain S-box-containing protein
MRVTQLELIGEVIQRVVSILQILASQLATAIENARLYKELTRSTQELEQKVEERTEELAQALEELTAERDHAEALYRITKDLGISLDLDRVLIQALALINEAVGVEHGSIMLLDPESGNLIDRAALGREKPLPRGGRMTHFRKGVGLGGWVLEHREPVIIEDVARDERWLVPPGQERLSKAAIAVPLAAGEDVLGVLLLYHPQPGYFNETHLKLVSATASQVAASINNAELYRMIRESAERLGGMLRAQQEEASKIRAILEGIADGVMVADARGNVILLNAASEEILGMSREEIVGRPIHELSGLYGAESDTWLALMKEWARALPAEGEPISLESQFETEEKVVSVHMAPVLMGDEFLGTVSIFRDITREVAERNRRVKAETLAAIGDMTGIMAHRMNNTLGAARANLLNIERKRARGELASEFVEESLQQVMGSIDKALEMLKTLSRPFRSDKELEKVNVNSCLSSALKPLTIPEGIQVIEDYTKDLPTVMATREYLIEVFGNLMTNAIEAMGDSGRLGLCSTLANNWVEVSVMDTGPGIPEELQENIFELGYSFKKTGDGLGFGLWWSRTFLERLGGSLHVESQVGAGSKFVVRLPTGAERE